MVDRVNTLHGVGLIPIEEGGQVLSGFGEVGVWLNLLLGWGFVVVFLFVGVFSSQEMIQFGLA